MSARSSMTMRATVSRKASVVRGTRASAPRFEEIGILVPCRVWSKSRRDVGGAVVEDMRGIIPASADVKEEDQLVVYDRLGVLQFEGPVLVETRTRKGGSGSRANHFELMLTRHTVS